MRIDRIVWRVGSIIMLLRVLFLLLRLGLFLDVFLFLFDLGITVFGVLFRKVRPLLFYRSFFNILMVDIFIDVLFMGNNLSFFFLIRNQALSL